MVHDEATPLTTHVGSWQDAEELRKWSFLRRTPQQRLDWLGQALTLAYQSGALKSAVHDAERPVEPKPKD
jgi:hypothetical protein